MERIYQRVRSWAAGVCLCSFLIICGFPALAQRSGSGSVTGNVIEEGTGKAVPEATVMLIGVTDPARGQTVVTGTAGDFSFSGLPHGVYRIRISCVGFNPLNIDTIHLRPERPDYSLNDLRLIRKNNEMDAVVVVAEKPLIQSRGGNITFNAAESPMAAGSSANELLRTVPLLTTDANGNLLLRGKTPIVLIDEKPVNLGGQQLQDFLDALPGNMIEKIEVMTNPPPAYANEEGGVINIITRKGKIGIGGRASVYGGTRGEYGGSLNLGYRDRRLAVNFNGGMGYNKNTGNGHSSRQNFYTDSSNVLNTANHYTNTNTRPNARLSIDYDLDKRNSLSMVGQINRNNYDNKSVTDYWTAGQHGALYGLSSRSNGNNGDNINPYGTLTYRHKGAQPNEQLELIASWNHTNSDATQLYYQQYLNPDHSFSGMDSTQRQVNATRQTGYDLRANYDKALTEGGKTFLSLGVFYNNNQERVQVTSSQLMKATGNWSVNDLLSSNLQFLQTKTNFRASVRQQFGKGWQVTAGSAYSRTLVNFDLYNTNKTTSNTYWNWLPFGNLSKTWDNQWNATLIYKKTIRRPDMDEMNPTIDYSDPYNLRFGNPQLKPCLTDVFELYTGKSTGKYYFNYSISLNKVQNIYNTITQLEPDGSTQTTWQNISNRTDYSTGTWSGYTFSRALRMNLGATYTWSQYGAYDHTVNKYQDNGSFNLNVNGSYSPDKLWNLNAGCQYNRNGNPQGISVGTVSMNLGIQRKFFDRRLIATLNIWDPFAQQSYTSSTAGKNFLLQSYSTSQTRNYRLTLSYDIRHTIDKGRKQLLKAVREGRS